MDILKSPQEEKAFLIQSFKSLFQQESSVDEFLDKNESSFISQPIFSTRYEWTYEMLDHLLKVINVLIFEGRVIFLVDSKGKKKVQFLLTVFSQSCEEVSSLDALQILFLTESNKRFQLDVKKDALNTKSDILDSNWADKKCFQA